MQTSLSERHFDIQQLNRLERLNHKQISLQLVYSPAKASLGYQYLLFMPYSVVYSEDIETALANQLRLACAVRGKVLNFSDQAPLKLYLEAPSISAYDLFFTRLIVAKLESKLAGHIFSQPISLRKSQFVSFAFRPQLENLLNQSLAEFAEKISYQIC